MIVHQGSLKKIDSSVHTRSLESPIHSNISQANTLYVVTISIPTASLTHNSTYSTDKTQLYDIRFSQKQYDFILSLFCILDIDSQGSLDWKTIFEFVILRCPVFRRRDASSSFHPSFHEPTQPSSSSLTFNEIWNLTIHCSRNIINTPNVQRLQLGIEGWMIFCRFMVVAQTLEIKRSFSSRHLQQTMQHKKEGKSSEVVLVQVPPLEERAPLDYCSLMEFESYLLSNQSDVPDMDIEFSFKDYSESLPIRLDSLQGLVQISEFRPGPSNKRRSSSNKLDYKDTHLVIEFHPHSPSNKSLVSKVKRSLKDLIWLHETFISNKVPGDTLWGRIIPPFPILNYLDSIRDDDLVSSSTTQQNLTQITTDAALTVATTGVGVLSSLAKSAKSLFVSKANKTPSSSTIRHTSFLSKSCKNQNAWREDDYSLPMAFERYLNYILENPVLSLSFAVHAMLKV